MSEEERQFRYVYDRILIESSRVNDSDFPDITVHLTGQELEILRNIMSYATRRTTFVGEYYDSYYRVADDTDWVVIESIVAELENKLMGDGNVTFGFNDVYQESESDDDVGTPTAELTFSLVPEGEVWVITQWVAVNEDTRTTNSILRIETPTAVFNCAARHPDVANHKVGTSVHVAIGYGQRVQVVFEGCSMGDVVRAWVSGYKMLVPV